ncbi:MAG: hypothetical protein ACKOTE_14370, partial [Opitutaceae bacterium]
MKIPASCLAPRSGLAICALLLFASVLHAAVATGVIEGRVFSPASGEYLAQARVTVEGAGLETF